MTDPPAVQCKGLRKSFGDVKAVDGIDFEVRKGEVFALLGPNGAGKSTTIKMLCTISRPTSGSVSVAGYDCATQPHAVRRRIGVVFQDRTLDDQLTAEENLRFHAVLYGIPADQIEARIARVLEIVDLADRRRDRVVGFSGGMARRLEVARGFLQAPQVLFLDEPTIGLDPQNRARMWKEVRRMRDEAGMAIVMTTHYMDEAEYADRIAIIDKGRIVAAGTPSELKRQIGLDTVLLATADDAAALEALRAAGFDAAPADPGVLVRIADGEGSVARIIKSLHVPISTVRVHRPTLDDVFLHFTGRQIRPEGPDDLALVRNLIAAGR